MSQFKGMLIKKKSKLNYVTVSWKQGSFCGFGGNQSHIYKVYVYSFDNGANILLFCQDTMNAPQTMVLGEK